MEFVPELTSFQLFIVGAVVTVLAEIFTTFAKLRSYKYFTEVVTVLVSVISVALVVVWFNPVLPELGAIPAGPMEAAQYLISYASEHLLPAVVFVLGAAKVVYNMILKRLSAYLQDKIKAKAG
jgi:hypothetical protein